MDESRITLESMSQALWYNRWTLSQFKRYLIGDILEIGCGIGTFTNQLEKFGAVWGIDIDRRNLKIAQKAVSSAKVGFGDIESGKYFFNRKKFTSIVCLNVLEHIQDDTRALKNIHRALIEQGYLVLLVPIDQRLFGQIDRSIGHYRRYNKANLIKLLRQSGFTIVSARRMNFLGGLGWFLAGRVFGERHLDRGKIKLFNLVAPLVLPLEQLFEPPFGTSVLIVATK